MTISTKQLCVLNREERMSKDDILHNILNVDDNAEDNVENITIGNEDEDKILRPLLPEINMIRGNELKHLVRSILLKADHFFATPDDPEKDLIAHTKHVFRFCKLLLEAQERDAEDCDLIYTAALIHDVTKLVEINSMGDLEIDPFHPYTVGSFVMWVRSQDDILTVSDSSSSLMVASEVLAQILRLVRCHMGSWAPVPETMPITSLEWILHNADYLATNLNYVLYSDLNE